MTETGSPTAKTHRKQQPRKDGFGTERFARVHNNLVRKDDGLGAAVGAGLTARQLDLLLELIAEAQRQGRERLEFQRIDAQKRLGLGGGKKDRKLLIDTLHAGSKVTIPPAIFFKPKKEPEWEPDESETEAVMYEEEVSREEAEKILWTEHLEEQGARRPKPTTDTPLPLLRYRRRLDGSVTVWLPERIVKAKKFWVPAYLTPMRALRSPQRKLLALLILSQRYLRLRWKPETVARKIGLRIVAPDQRKVWLRKAMRNIGEVYGLEAGCERGPGSTMVLTLKKPLKEQTRYAAVKAHVLRLQDLAEGWRKLSADRKSVV